MYLPLPTRPKKTNAVRSRTGCLRCRQQKRKCDETRPNCLRCTKRGLACARYSAPFRFLDATPRTAAAPFSSSSFSRNSRQNENQTGPVSPTTVTAVPSPMTLLPPTRQSPIIGYGVDHSLLSPPQPEPVSSHERYFEATSSSSLSSVASKEPEPGHLNTIEQPRPSSYSQGTPHSEEEYHSPWTQLGAGYHINNGSGDHSDYDFDFEVVESFVPTMADLETASPSAVSISPLPPPLSNVDRLYWAHFIAHVVPLLRESAAHFTLESSAYQVPAVRHASMALSAAHLAYLEGSTSPSFCRRRTHVMKSAYYYSEATKRLQQDDLLPEALAITIVILTHFESELGTIQGSLYHISALDNLIIANEDQFAATPTGKHTLQAWIGLRARATELSFASRLYAEEEATTTLRTIAYKYATPDSVVSMVSAEAISIIRRLVMASCMRLGYEDTGSVLGKLVTWYSIMRNPVSMASCSPSSHPLPLSGVLSLLPELRKRLADVALDTRSLFSKISQLSAIQSAAQCSQDLYMRLGVVPLRFETHQQTMMYAKYALAQLACEEDLIRYITCNNQGRSMELPNSRWMQLLLCIAEGVDPEACLSQNTYGQGISIILYNAVMCCPQVDTLSYLSLIFFPRLQQAGRVREGASIPLDLFSRAIQCYLREAISGRQVFLGTVNIDQYSSMDDIFSLISQPLTLIVHGRDKRGSYFSDCVSVSTES